MILLAKGHYDVVSDEDRLAGTCKQIDESYVEAWADDWTQTLNFKSALCAISSHPDAENAREIGVRPR
jgi:hypothetical protein